MAAISFREKRVDKVALLQPKLIEETLYWIDIIDCVTVGNITMQCTNNQIRRIGNICTISSHNGMQHWDGQYVPGIMHVVQILFSRARVAISGGLIQ